MHVPVHARFGQAQPSRNASCAVHHIHALQAIDSTAQGPRLPRPLPLPGRKPRLSQLEARLKSSHHGRRPRRHVSRAAYHPRILSSQVLRSWRRRFLLPSLSTRWVSFLGSRDLMGVDVGTQAHPCPGPATLAPALLLLSTCRRLLLGRNQGADP